MDSRKYINIDPDLIRMGAINERLGEIELIRQARWAELKEYLRTHNVKKHHRKEPNLRSKKVINLRIF